MTIPYIQIIKLLAHMLIQLWAVNDAISKGAEEAILLDKNGFISEGSGENLFIVKNSKLMTPTTDYCLNGITRQSVITIAQNLAINRRREEFNF
jgi:branched-chain amino acid aminotransferase